MLKINDFKNNPTGKTNNGYHMYFSCNDERLKRITKFMNSEF